MSRGNPLWGAPRIHGELRKLGIEVSEATVSKYLARFPKPPSQTWRTFLRNHAMALASIDFLVLPTATFRLLRVFIVLHHERKADRPLRRDGTPNCGMGAWPFRSSSGRW